jgi:fimbrial chaperone protein
MLTKRKKSSDNRYRNWTILFSCMLILLICPVTGLTAQFSLNPVRVFFDGANKTNIITVHNDSDEEITLQLNAFKWEQDDKGKDVYSPTKDIIFFPRIVKIKPAEDKIIRLGTRVIRKGREQTYRLYLEEIPTPSTSETTTVRLVMKVGVPIFIAPSHVDAKGKIEKAALTKGNLDLAINNEGTIHFIVRAIRVAGIDDSGNEIYKTDIGGKYILGGNRKDFSFVIPQEDCHRLKTLNIDVDTDRLSLGEKLAVHETMCQL